MSRLGIKATLRRTPLDTVHKSMKKAFQRSRLHARLHGELPWPYQHCMVTTSPPVVYLPISKVASTNIKKWLLRESGIPEEDWVHHPLLGINQYAQEMLHPRSMEPFSDPSYFKFVFVRDPYRRLVSGFLDKFVRPYAGQPEKLDASPARAVLTWIKARRRYATRQDACFEDFVEYVCASPNLILDKHWLPQSSFVGPIEFDFVGKMESFKRDFDIVRERAGSKVDFKIYWERTEYRASTDAYSGATPISELCKMDPFPSPDSFYSEGFRDRVARRYAEDFLRFGYPIHRT